ncbi:MAG: DUF4124 domain-containing protein [Gammaproteobacteria bacterium]|nr:DUF4124 domain-containing protein [Gammaproteobacteria bacterium]
MTRSTDSAARASRFLRRLAVVALGLALISLAQQGSSAGVYRWVDDQGKVHYGDRPPSKDKARSIEIESAPAPAPDDHERRAKTRRLLDAMESERNREKEQAAQAKAEQARRERNCEVARRHVTLYQRANKISRVGAEGKRTYLSDEERNQALIHAQSLVDRWCK